MKNRIIDIFSSRGKSKISFMTKTNIGLTNSRELAKHSSPFGVEQIYEAVGYRFKSTQKAASYILIIKTEEHFATTRITHA